MAQRPLDPQETDSPLPVAPAIKGNPGALAPADFGGSGVTVIGGRRRSGVIPKHHGHVTRPLTGPALSTLNQGLARPEDDKAATASSFLSPFPIEDLEGPVDGLTIDAALERMQAENIEIRAFAKEIPQADADLLTAGLRNNPLLYADTQFIPYGANNAAKRPIGPTQYDVAVILPLDLSHKRNARVRVACAARSVVQAQYQDAVRRQIANVTHAFIDLQVAYQAELAITKAWEEHELMLKRLRKDPLKTPEDLRPIELQSSKWEVALNDANDTLGDAREALGLLLNVPPEESEFLVPRGKMRVDPPVMPSVEELTRTSLRYRPDLAALRLGIKRADAEIGLAKANAFDDVILFVDPLSYQDNRPAHLPSGRSWDLGVTVPLPLNNRNQGNIAKARVNATQTRLEYSALERRVLSEVRLASRELKSSRLTLDRIELTFRPEAIKAVKESEADFFANKIKVDDYLAKLEDEQDAAKQQRDALVRYRRACFDLNAAVGLRILP
jgi:cobalt-zinc-cadmium efflux system outer membrane protein